MGLFWNANYLHFHFLVSLALPVFLRLLNSLAHVFAKFPTNEEALDVALRTLPLCASSLPTQALPIMTELQMNALEAFSQFEFETNPSVLSQAVKFIVILWSTYPMSLPASSNMKQLAHLIVTSLRPEVGSKTRIREAISCGSDFVSFLMRLLSDSQVEALDKEGVYLQLRSLVMFYDEMTLEELRQIVIGVGIFAELRQCVTVFLEENSYVWFIQALLKHPSDESLQGLIWQLFTVLCKCSKKICESLFDVGLLESVLSLLQNEGTYVLPVVRFLVRCTRLYPNIFVKACHSNKDLVRCLVGMLKEDGPREKAADELLLSLAEILASLCNCSLSQVATVIDLNILSRLQNCARARPDILLVLACVAIEGISICFHSSNQIASMVEAEPLKSLLVQYSNQNYHMFFREMMSDQRVSCNSSLIKLLYITFQKILKPFTPEALKEKVHIKDFIEFFTICFIRDTITFQSLISRIAFTTHFFIYEMKNKEPISILNDLNFHITVANLLQGCTTPETICTTMGLMACLVGKYYEHLKEVKPFLNANVPRLLLEKAKLMGTHVQFSDDFGRIMLNLTADKGLSKELFEDSYMEKLLEVFENKRMSGVRRSVIHAIGNIALGGQNIKQLLLNKQFYNPLFSILRMEMKTADPFLISACCRVLHILASGDWVKRKFVESGCIELLLQLMQTRQENSEVQWRPLGLLSSLGFMAVINRRFILTNEILEVVASILRKSSNGKVISYTTLVFLGSDELDSGARKLREIGVVENLQAAIDNPMYRKQAPDLERWGVHVLEKQNLYTLSVPKNAQFSLPPTCPTYHPSDWPPYIVVESSVDKISPSSPSSPSSLSSSHSVLLPLDEAYFKPNTPVAPELCASALQQLVNLGLNPDKPLFRVGRLYGSTHGLCSNCDKENPSEELVIRPLSMTVEQYQQLVDCGWYRRGGVKMFRLRNNHNMECCDWETRVLVNKFDHRKHKSYKKVLKRMPVDRLTVETCPAHFSKEAFDLYNDYHVKKHDKPLKSEYSYCEHAVNTPTTHQTINGIEYGTFHQLYRLDGKLVAVGIIDVIPKGMVSIYMWYDVSKEISKYSFGVYSALKEIEMVRAMSERNPRIQYYYLQGWNCNNKKLNYKANYEPEEFYCPCIIPDWVSSLDGVALAKKKVIGGDSTTIKTEEQPDGVTEDQSQQEMGGDRSEEGGGTSQKVDPMDPINKVCHDVPVKQVPCRAFSLDKTRFEQLAGLDLNISKIVICLNYSEYLYFEDLLLRYEVDKNQQEIMKSRFEELYVSLSPELRSQLVVDMMVSRTVNVVGN